MSWIQELFDTYNNCQSAIGMENSDDEVPLIPICHTTQKAQLEIIIDEAGCYKRARVIPKKEARTIIPCTESSGGRTSGEAPHPLCDKLQYLARDYKQYGGKKKSYFYSYAEKLSNWCSSSFSDLKIIAVLAYIKKGEVIKDLITDQILVPGSDGKLLDKWVKEKDQKPPKIFDVTNSQEDVFVRWVVEIPGVMESHVWKDKVLWQKWINYYSNTKTFKSLCYVSGKVEFSADQHPAKIRNDGDKAKIISGNDDSGFTFRGRFVSSEQAASVGFETTQKAHFALRWLIGRQGYVKGDLAVVAWSIFGEPVPKPTDDTLSMIGIESLISDDQSTVATAQEIAIRLKKRIAGYSQQLGKTKDIVVMGLDSATPGRLSITYYRKLTGSDFLERINDWHMKCTWLHSYRTVEIKDDSTGRIKKVTISFIGAPSPSDIAEAAYGPRLDDKLRKTTIARILPCIIDGQPIPRDLVESTVRRACNRAGKNFWEWNKSLTIACALFKKYNRKEKFDMALDVNRKTRDYLYGRLLALADNLEGWALSKANEKRETNAARLMQRFAERPFSTWRTIELALSPYKARLGGKASKRLQMIDDVIASFDPVDFTSDKRLSGEFLLGYHSQREFLRPIVKENKENDEEIESENNDQ